MSKPAAAPAPKPDFLRIVLLAMILFLGYNLFTGGFGERGQTDTRTTEQIFETMQELNAELRDVSIVRQLPVYERRLREDMNAGRLTEEQKEVLLIEARLLVADTQFKSGLYRDEYAKINNAYLTLQGYHERFSANPVWQQTFEVSPVATERVNRPQDEISGQQLYQEIVAELSRRNQERLVLGVFPGYQIIDFLVNLTGKNPGYSYAIAALILAIIVRAIIWPLAQRQLMWGRKMSQLLPYINEIKEKHTDKKTGKIRDQQAWQADTFELYKSYGINPVAGCLPALAQAPLFLLVYQFMLYYKFEFTNGVFLWINPNSTSFLGIPLAPNLGERDYLLVFFYGISMIVTTLLTPVSDPTQVRKQRMFGIGIAATFSIVMFFWVIPSAFVLYWIFTNIFATLQSLRAYRLPMPPLQKVAAPGGGVFPVDGVLNPKNGAAPNGKAVNPDFFGKTGSRKLPKDPPPKGGKPKKSLPKPEATEESPSESEAKSNGTNKKKGPNRAQPKGGSGNKPRK